MGHKITEYWVDGSLRKVVEKITPDKTEETEPIGEIVTAPRFEDMIYEPHVENLMKMIVEECKRKAVNLLLFGNGGVGKTTTAKMIACETGRPFVYLTGSMGQKKIVEMLLNAKENSLVLIDEIHNLPEKIAEIIYPAIQDGEIYKEGERIKLNNLMFIGTTTEPQDLPKPLSERFRQIELEELEPERLAILLKKRGCSDKVAGLLLNFTHNIRIINNLLDLCNTFGGVNEDNLVKVFRLRKINLYSGLSHYQEKYLKILNEQKRASLRTLCLMIRKSENYIKYEIEPDLIRKGMIIVTSRGRELNPEFKDFGYEELKRESEKSHADYSIDEREIAIQYLNDNPELKKKFGKRYLELVDFIAEKIAQGVSPDLIDFSSFSNDDRIEESYKRNYLEEL